MGPSPSELHALGQNLAHELRGYARRTDVVVLARMPKVVPLAAEVAQTLRAPLDLFLVRPLGLTEGKQREIGIVASGGVLVLDSQMVKARAISATTIATAAQACARDLAGFEAAYRGEQPPLDLRHRHAIVVDDGRGDLFMLRMTVAALRRRWVQRVVLAAPTMPAAVCSELLTEADEIVAALTQQPAIESRPSSGGQEPAVSAVEITQLLRRTLSPFPTAL